MLLVRNIFIALFIGVFPLNILGQEVTTLIGAPSELFFSEDDIPRTNFDPLHPFTGGVKFFSFTATKESAEFEANDPGDFEGDFDAEIWLFQQVGLNLIPVDYNDQNLDGDLGEAYLDADLIPGEDYILAVGLKGTAIGSIRFWRELLGVPLSLEERMEYSHSLSCGDVNDVPFLILADESAFGLPNGQFYTSYGSLCYDWVGTGQAMSIRIDKQSSQNQYDAQFTLLTYDSGWQILESGFFDQENEQSIEFFAHKGGVYHLLIGNDPLGEYYIGQNYLTVLLEPSDPNESCLGSFGNPVELEELETLLSLTLENENFPDIGCWDNSFEFNSFFSFDATETDTRISVIFGETPPESASEGGIEVSAGNND
ncbi:MAG: hypothetical protein AAF193_01725, partial [Bacteroidota bacterium]